MTRRPATSASDFRLQASRRKPGAKRLEPRQRAATTTAGRIGVLERLLALPQLYRLPAVADMVMGDTGLHLLVRRTPRR